MNLDQYNPHNDAQTYEARLALFLKRFEEVFGKEFDESDLQDKDLILSLFLPGNDKNTVGKSLFFQRKSFIKDLYQWFYENGIVEKSLLDYISSLVYGEFNNDIELSRFYFSDLDEIIELINVAGRLNGLDDEDTLNIKVPAIFAWFGLEREEIIDVRKSDLNTYHDGVFVISKSNRVVDMPQKYYEMLRVYSDIGYYRGFPSGRKQYFVSSRHLLRSFTKSKMDLTSITKIFQHFNKFSIERMGKGLNYSIIKRNGIFFKILKEERPEESLTKLISEEMKCDLSNASGHKMLYNQWKKMYHEGDFTDL